MPLDSFHQEIAILRACRDANIVQFQGAYLGPEETLLVTEYMEGGDLMSNIAAGRVTWWRRGRKIAIDVAKGLCFLHARRIVHFDLKSPNILLTRDGTAKIADVGMARFISKDFVTGVVSTLAWSAPEQLWRTLCSEKCDIYSYGIVLWEICTGEKPVRGQLRDVNVPQECPEEVRNLMLQCLETRPSRRPTAVQIVQTLQRIAEPPPVGPSAAHSLQGTSTPVSPRDRGRDSVRSVRSSAEEEVRRTSEEKAAAAAAAAAADVVRFSA